MASFCYNGGSLNLAQRGGDYMSIITGVDNRGQTTYTSENMWLTITHIPGKNRKTPEGSFWISFRQKMPDGGTQRGPEMLVEGKGTILEILGALSIIESEICLDGAVLCYTPRLGCLAHGKDGSGQIFFNFSNIRVTITNGESAGYAGFPLLSFREYVGDGNKIHRGPQTPIWEIAWLHELREIFLTILREI